MTGLSPTIGFLIAAAAAGAAGYTTVWFLRGQQPDWIAMMIPISCYGIAFGLLSAMPSQPPAAVPITTILIVAAVVIPKALRRTAKRRRAQRSAAEPPDIEHIP
jgi:CHASE2 domain-containing sensor protein